MDSTAKCAVDSRCIPRRGRRIRRIGSASKGPIRREKSFKSVVFASLVPGSRHACDPPLSWVGQSLVAVFFDPINSATPLLERNAISKSGAIGTLALFLRLRKVV